MSAPVEYGGIERSLVDVARRHDPAAPQVIPSPGALLTLRNQLTRTVTNLPIRVPTMDWEHVAVGEKRMFRAYHARSQNRQAPIIPADTPTPRPCLLYAARYQGKRVGSFQVLPAILTAFRQEPLGSITPEDLAAEGFQFLPAFRFYWKRRYPRIGWCPWDTISVVQIRPVSPEDWTWMAQWAIEHLYSEWW